MHAVSTDSGGFVRDWSNTNGSSTWSQTQVSGPAGGSAPAVTISNGSVNIAGVDTSGDLDFNWQDSSGQHHRKR